MKQRQDGGYYQYQIGFDCTFASTKETVDKSKNLSWNYGKMYLEADDSIVMTGDTTINTAGGTYSLEYSLPQNWTNQTP